MKRFLQATLPRPVRQPLRWGVYVGTVLSELLGVHPRECNLCGYKGSFKAFGHPPRYDAECPRCSSLERHRQLKLWFDRSQDVLTDRVEALHFAPEPTVERYIRPRVRSYQSADYEPGRADLTLNIEQLELPNQAFDLIICSHVLEHVDDRKALGELFRVLRPGGRALLMVPVVEGWRETYENPSITSPSDRRLHFGQKDHVRYFGADVRDRIRSAKFELEEFVAQGLDVLRYGLVRGETLFIAQRPTQ